MPDEDEECKSVQDGGRVRKPRREIQIYRPGMLRKGTDLTLGTPPPSSKPPEELIKERPPKIPTENGRFSGRRSENPRRQSNDSESQHSYRGDSGSTTPDAASVSSASAYRTKVYVRGGGGNTRRDNRDSRFNNDDAYSNYSSRNGSQFSSRQGSRDDIREDRNTRPNKPYDSTQSLYDSRKPGGYLDSRAPRKPDFRRSYVENPPVGSRFQRMPKGNERASMRAEVGHRRQTGRRRNDSINSTQSERPPHMELSVDTGLETQSQAGDAPSSSSMTYLQICESFESLGSINWSEEMEAEYNEKMRKEEEEKAKQLQQKLEACASEMNQGGDDDSKAVRGILRVNLSDYPKGSSYRQSRGRGGYRGGRVRKDSDRSSSFGGSIAEEGETEEDELGSGERTPTKEMEREDRKWSSRGGRQRKGFGTSNRKPENGRNGKYHENHDPNDFDASSHGCPISPKYKGNHDLEREEVPPSRLHGRLAFPRRYNNEENYDNHNNRRSGNQKGYQQPRRQEDFGTSAVILKSNRTAASSAEPIQTQKRSQRLEEERQMPESPIYSHIAKEHRARMQKINEAISADLPRVAQRHIDAARRVRDYSHDLCQVYYDFIMEDMNFTFGANLEQHLWKHAFHKIIDALKTACNTPGNPGKQIREILVELLETGIGFYERLLEEYEIQYEFTMSRVLTWPSGLPLNDFGTILPYPLPFEMLTSRQKLALKSYSRHLISMGDLFRYRSLVGGSEDYSIARSCYLKASLLWPSTGHPYNQLAVVAYFSMLYRSSRRARHIPIQILSNQRQERVLDEIFFCVRALTAAHPFEAAKERLFSRLASMRKKVDKYESLLDSETGKVQGESELAARRDRPRELWIAVNGVDEAPERSLFDMYLEQQPAQLHRRAVSYIIDTAGLLITKIGMEHFGSVSERALSQLAALILIPDSPITSQQLIQMSLILIYAVHVSAIKSEPGTCSLQQQLAVQTVISLFGALLEPLHKEMSNISKFLNGEKDMPRIITRVLPAISIVSEWLSCPHASNIYRTMPSTDPLPIQTVKLNTWSKLADISNLLVTLEDTGLLGRLEASDGSRKCVLPEFVYVASFLTVFPTFPRMSEITILPKAEKNAVTDVHVRLRSLLVAAEFIDGSTLNSFFYDEDNGEFRSNDWHDEETAEAKPKTNGKAEQADDDTNDRTREELLQREKNKQKTVIVVRPVNLVPDTNAFVDHLDKVKKIVESGRFQVIVPTIVIEELLGLSQCRTLEIPTEHEKFVTEEAKKAVAWLKEKVKEKCPKMNTLTTQGKKMTICIVSEDTGDYGEGRVNDDRILQSCTSFVENFATQPFTDVALPPLEGTPIYRNLVLLSEDRGICIKATSQNIPNRTVPSFVKWAGI